MVWVRDIDSLYNFIGYVVLRAPNRFPIEDYLAPDVQMDLDRAFVELRRGIAFVCPRDSDQEETLFRLLDASLIAYKTGNEVSGAHLLHAFQDSIFKQ